MDVFTAFRRVNSGKLCFECILSFVKSKTAPEWEQKHVEL